MRSSALVLVFVSSSVLALVSAQDTCPTTSELSTHVTVNNTNAAGGQACGGRPDPWTQEFAAVNSSCFDKIPNLCQKCAKVTGPKGTKTMKIVDKCPGCGDGHMDLSPKAAFDVGGQPMCCFNPQVPPGTPTNGPQPQTCPSSKDGDYKVEIVDCPTELQSPLPDANLCPGSPGNSFQMLCEAIIPGGFPGCPVGSQCQNFPADKNVDGCSNTPPSP